MKGQRSAKEITFFMQYTIVDVQNDLFCTNDS